MTDLSWHGIARVDGAWETRSANRSQPGYEIVAEVDDGSDEPYEQAATAAVLRTPDGQYWAAEDSGGCSCWSGPSSEAICGPYDTIAEALRAISEPLRERFPEGLA